MNRVPPLMVLFPCWRQGSRSQGGDTIVDEHQGRERVQNRSQPDHHCRKTEEVVAGKLPKREGQLILSLRFTEARGKPYFHQLSAR